MQILRILKKNHGVEFSRLAVLSHGHKHGLKSQRHIVWLQENSEQTARVIQKRCMNDFGLSISLSQVKKIAVD